MEYQIVQYQSLPIFIVTNTGKPSLEDALRQYQDLAHILDAYPQGVYMIFDNVQLDFDFADTMLF